MRSRTDRKLSTSSSTLSGSHDRVGVTEMPPLPMNGIPELSPPYTVADIFIISMDTAHFRLTNARLSTIYHRAGNQSGRYCRCAFQTTIEIERSIERSSRYPKLLRGSERLQLGSQCDSATLGCCVNDASEVLHVT